jgi:hypothetical protein
MNNMIRGSAFLPALAAGRRGIQPTCPWHFVADNTQVSLSNLNDSRGFLGNSKTGKDSRKCVRLLTPFRAASERS